MAWTEAQIKMAAVVKTVEGLRESDRLKVLGLMPNAFYDERGEYQWDFPSSKSSELSDEDFEFYMATIEAQKGGCLLDWDAGHWKRLHAAGLLRMRDEVARLNKLLVGRVMSANTLVDWTRDRSEGRTNNYRELARLIVGHKILARRKGVPLE